MITVMNNELHKKVKEDINNYKYCDRKMMYKTVVSNKVFAVEYPARCFNCVEKFDKDKVENQKTPNMDLRILICMIYH